MPTIAARQGFYSPKSLINMFKQSRFSFAILLLTVFSFSCERVEPAKVQQLPRVAASEQVNLSSRGYNMSIDTDLDFAKITTDNNGPAPLPSDPLIIAGPSVPEISFTGDVIELEDENGVLIPYDVLAMPNDGRDYWAVPFAPGSDPVNVSDLRIIILIGNCRCGSNTAACQNSGLGCVTGVCAVCSRDIIIIMDKVYRPPFGEPFALVTANAVEVNGVLYQ